MVTVAEELVLLAYTEAEGKALIGLDALNAAVAAALLAELAVLGRVEERGGRLVVLDGAAPQDELLAEVLGLVAAGRRSPGDWVGRIGSDRLRERVLERLVRAGVLRKEHTRVLRLFPRLRWPEADPAPEAEVRARLTTASATGEADDRTRVLLSLLHATKLDRRVLRDPRAAQALTGDQWAAEAVRRTVATLGAAATAATIAAIT